MRAIQRKGKFHIYCVIMILPEFKIKGPFTTEPRHRFLSFLESTKWDRHDLQKSISPVDNYMFKFNNRNTRTRF